MTFSETILENTILFFAGHVGVSDLGVTKLYELMYFADAGMLREADRSITGSKYIKYPPVLCRAVARTSSSGCGRGASSCRSVISMATR